MGFNSRKFLIWLISLAVVLAVFLLYNRLSKTPPIDIYTGPKTTDTVADSNVGEIGMVGDKIGLGKVRKAKFIHLNEQKQVDREFGFETLLHEQGDQWEIEKPYMNIFRRNFKCYLTADKGMVQVEDAIGGSKSPRDATFTGNVAIHILPENSSRFEECFIYLDDIVFISEKSQFSTAGTVKFISRKAQMLGTGFELVYNDELDRLEFLRIVHLKSLRLKSPQAAWSSSPQTNVDTPSGTASHVQTQRPAAPVVADVPEKAQTSSTPSRQALEKDKGEYYRCVFSGNVVIDTPEQLIFADEVCINNIFSPKAQPNQPDKAGTVSANGTKTDNMAAAKKSKSSQLDEQFVDVVVTCDNGIVVTPMDSPRAAGNSVKLEHGTVATGSQDTKSLNAAAGRTTFVAQKIDYCALTGDVISIGSSELTFYADDITGTDTNEAAVPVKIAVQEKVEFLQVSNQVTFEGDCLCTMLREDPNSWQKFTLSAPKLTVDLSGDKDEKSSTLAAGIEHLTANGGVVKLTIVETPKDSVKFGHKAVVLDSRGVESQNDTAEQTTFTARRIDYTVSTGEIVADGPSKLIFYTNDVTSAGTDEARIPVTVTAQKQTRFLPQLNQVIFEGDCLCTMLLDDPNGQQQYTLAAPKLTVNLSGDRDKQFFTSAAGIENLTADGGVVKLATLKTKGEEFLGGIELKCRKFDFDNTQRVFVATGPGIIKVDNSSIAEPEEQVGKFSLQKPCWVLVEDFDILEYSLKSNRIIADVGPQGALLINYFPVVEGQIRYDQQAAATASHIEVNLIESGDGEFELSMLRATGGIHYEEEDVEFAGSELFYDHSKSIITVRGDEFQPCLLNNTHVDGIEYNLETGKINAEIVAPGALQTKSKIKMQKSK